MKFPNTSLDLHHGPVALDRAAGGPLRVRILDGQAEGQVGDYHLVLNPTGQVYPDTAIDPGNAPLGLGAETTPYLDTPYVLASLMGPIITPPLGVGSSVFSALTPAERQAASAATLTGFLLPGLGTQNVSLAYEFEGPLGASARAALRAALRAVLQPPDGAGRDTAGGASPTRSRPATRWVEHQRVGQSRWQAQPIYHSRGGRGRRGLECVLGLRRRLCGSGEGKVPLPWPARWAPDSAANFRPVTRPKPRVSDDWCWQGRQWANPFNSRWALVYDRPSRDCDRSGQRAAEAFEDLFDAYEQKIFNVLLPDGGR